MTGALSRRRFLAAGGVAAGLTLAAGACSGGDDAGAPGDGGQAPPPTERPSPDGDLAVADLAARVERLALDTYGATLSAAGGARLGDVPPALADYLATANAHHVVHLSSWNTMLRAGGFSDVTEPLAALKPLIDARFAEVTDALGAARLVLVLEDVASQTYNRAIPTLKSREAIRLAAQIQVVDQQHISVLRYLLGLYPVGSGDVPESRAFQPTERAASG